MTTKLEDVRYRPATANDLAAISALHAAVFGPGRFTRTAYRVREGRPMLSDFCRIAELEAKLVAAVSFTPIAIGGSSDALLLGPLAVATGQANIGIGRELVRQGLEEARTAGRRLVVLVGDQSYYGRLGFTPVPAGQITFPGPVDPARILACELADGALADYSGLITADA